MVNPDAFALDRSWIHLAASGPAPTVRAVIDAVERHRRGLDANPLLYHRALDDETSREARALASRFLGDVGAAAIDFAADAASALVDYAGSLRLDDRDEVLMLECEPYAMRDSLSVLCDRNAASLYLMPLGQSAAEADERSLLERFDEAIERRTRLVVASWVNEDTGIRLPVRAIGDLIDRINDDRRDAERIHFAVDGSAGVLDDAAPIDSMYCDFFTARLDRAVYGPRGVAVTWRRNRRRPGDANRPAPELEWAALEAFEFLNDLGRQTVVAQVRSLAAQLRAGLSAIEGVRVESPTCESAASSVVCVEAPGVDDLPAQLRAMRVIASDDDTAPWRARFGVHPFTSHADIDSALACVRTIVSRRA